MYLILSSLSQLHILFHFQLRNCDCKQELGRSYFEARIAPFNDPTLKVIWLKDGRPLPNANRIQVYHSLALLVTMTSLIKNSYDVQIPNFIHILK